MRGGGRGMGAGRGRGWGGPGRGPDWADDSASMAAALDELLSRVAALEGTLGAVQARLAALLPSAEEPDPADDAQ